MRHKKNIFKSPGFNLFATLLLVVALAFFYKFATSDYSSNIKKDMETIDTDRLNNIVEAPKTAEEALYALEHVKSARDIDIHLLEYCHDNIRDDIYDRICDYLEVYDYTDDLWEELCGYTLKALYDLANGYTEDFNYVERDDPGDSLTLSFAGDISLDSTKNHWWSPLVVHKNNRGNLLEAAFSSELSEKMLGSDLFSVNLESPFVSGESNPIDENWRHGSSAENISVLGTLGIDLVNIANDRIYDYSAKGLADTLNTLELHNIAYIGGGTNLEDAKTPRYFIACGRKIAFVSASQAKRDNTMSPEASTKAAGIIYATNSNYFTAMIKEAKENADYVIVYTDWEVGTNQKPDASEAVLAHNFIEAGADIVIGTKGKIMQSIEYYQGKPIIYGLGSFWYETDKHENIYLELKFTKDAVYNTASQADSHFDPTQTRYSVNKEPMIYCLPCVQDKATARLVLGTNEGEQIINKLVNISDNKIAIAEDGLLSESFANTIN